MKKLITGSIAVLTLSPLFAFAQLGENNFGKIGDSVTNVMGFINGYLVPLVFAVAFIAFLWGAFKFFIRSDKTDERDEGKQYMIWAVVGFVLMVSVWGIVNVLANGLGLNDQSIRNIPEIPTTR